MRLNYMHEKWRMNLTYSNRELVETNYFTGSHWGR